MPGEISIYEIISASPELADCAEAFGAIARGDGVIDTEALDCDNDGRIDFFVDGAETGCAKGTAFAHMTVAQTALFQTALSQFGLLELEVTVDEIAARLGPLERVRAYLGEEGAERWIAEIASKAPNRFWEAMRHLDGLLEAFDENGKDDEGIRSFLEVDVVAWVNYPYNEAKFCDNLSTLHALSNALRECTDMDGGQRQRFLDFSANLSPETKRGLADLCMALKEDERHSTDLLAKLYDKAYRDDPRDASSYWFEITVGALPRAVSGLRKAHVDGVGDFLSGLIECSFDSEHFYDTRIALDAAPQLASKYPQFRSSDAMCQFINGAFPLAHELRFDAPSVASRIIISAAELSYDGHHVDIGNLIIKYVRMMPMAAELCTDSPERCREDGVEKSLIWPSPALPRPPLPF